MNNAILLLVALTFMPSVLCKADITFKVEELSKPEKLLSVGSSKDIYEKLIRSQVGVDSEATENKNLSIPYNIVAQSKISGPLVNYGYHSFFVGMYQAYAEHRPFVLSPDMVWLLISQGFARHVNANAEKMRNQFVGFSGKVSLVVTSTTVTIDNPNSPWGDVFPEFTKQIAERTGSELIKTLSSDFSTTTITEKIASEITIMESMKPYFEFIHMYVACGIPEITLSGTPEDWQRVVDKTRQLSKYDLTWWTSELQPILEEFVNASKGKVKKSFWMNMLKYHEPKMCGAPMVVDGWIVKFYPYDKDGKRNNLKELHGFERLPDEIVKVDLKYIDMESKIETPLELWAGFVGLEQNNKNYTLTPRIGWMIRKADMDMKFAEKNANGANIEIRVDTVPSALFQLNEIGSLSITFVDQIVIPDELSRVKIWMLKLSGKIEAVEAERIKALFPDTYVLINGKEVKGKVSK